MEFWHFLFLCIFKEIESKTKSSIRGIQILKFEHSKWSGFRYSDDVYSCCWQWVVMVAFSGIAFDMTLLNSSILCFKCTWIIQLFWSVLDTECCEYVIDFCNLKYINSWNRRNLSVWLLLSITTSERRWRLNSDDYASPNCSNAKKIKGLAVFVTYFKKVE